MGDPLTRSPTPSRDFYGDVGQQKRRAPSHVYDILPPAEAALFETLKQQSHIQHPDKSKGIRYRIRLSIRKAAATTGYSRETMRKSTHNLRAWKLIDYAPSPSGTSQYIIRPYPHWKKRAISEVTSENPRKHSKIKNNLEQITRSTPKSTKVKGNKTRPVQTATVPTYQVPRLRPLPTPSVYSLLGHINRHFNTNTSRNCAPKWKPVPARREHAEWIAGKTGIHAVVNGMIDPETCITFGEFDKLCIKVVDTTREASGDPTMDAGLLERKPAGAEYTYGAVRSAMLTYYVRCFVASKKDDRWDRKKEAKYWVIAHIEASAERNILRREKGKRAYLSSSNVFQFIQDPTTKRRTVLDETHLIRDDRTRKMAAAYGKRINDRWQTGGRHKAADEKRRAEEEARATIVLPPELGRDRCHGILAMLDSLEDPAPRRVPVPNPPSGLEHNLAGKNRKVVVTKILPFARPVPSGVGKTPPNRLQHLGEARCDSQPDRTLKSASEIFPGLLGRVRADQDRLQRGEVEKRTTPAPTVDPEAWRRHLDRQREFIRLRDSRSIHGLNPFKKDPPT